jgi:hypothetical protein
LTRHGVHACATKSGSETWIPLAPLFLITPSGFLGARRACPRLAACRTAPISLSLLAVCRLERG